ncbi:unnamed protein product [Camellia sinensis]
MTKFNQIQHKYIRNGDKFNTNTDLEKMAVELITYELKKNIDIDQQFPRNQGSPLMETIVHELKNHIFLQICVNCI